MTEGPGNRPPIADMCADLDAFVRTYSGRKATGEQMSIALISYGMQILMQAPSGKDVVGVLQASLTAAKTRAESKRIIVPSVIIKRP